MRIVIGSDHAGFRMKENIVKHLKNENVDVVDVGTNNEESVDYPNYGKKVGNEVVNGNYDFGIVICGTGIGISIAANKVKGVRAALIHDLETARLAKEHNNANVIAIGGRNTDFSLANKMVDEFMKSKFEERHQRRLDLISKMEAENE
ncbi:MAG: ribose 5-phosphate isomerase B [Acholeplasma sp.]|nr:ribose 5-phosphate isomerase B [Acholeplasma sp.]